MAVTGKDNKTSGTLPAYEQPSNAMIDQDHLDFEDTVNYGSFYTPDDIVDIVYDLLEKNVPDFGKYIIIDSSCGYGSFLRKPGSIGADIDEAAVRIARKRRPDCRFIHHNSLSGINRSHYDLDDEKIILVGNPPYNDTTSLVRKKMKRDSFAVAPALRKRDVGISFLLSYARLAADYICVLHPLSYLIKNANFRALNSFTCNYTLIDCIVIGSGYFSATSKMTQFPIVIALYKYEGLGMSYGHIMKYGFRTREGKIFTIGQYDWLGDYATKYPNRKHVSPDDTRALFWTMRDVNALKRSQTFMKEERYNSIRVTKEKFHYYCYADVFKDYIKHIPYYFGNCDIMLDHGKFNEIKDLFVAKSLDKYPFLRAGGDGIDNCSNVDGTIKNYFREFMGDHYVE
ncbi:MAG: SAM-dependent methyltransferase [Planctomycetota bacterium]|nr:SAM-dependent methyltransferase [Planctomycetota bacterium]